MLPARVGGTRGCMARPVHGRSQSEVYLIVHHSRDGHLMPVPVPDALLPTLCWLLWARRGESKIRPVIALSIGRPRKRRRLQCTERYRPLALIGVTSEAPTVRLLSEA